MVSIVLEEGVNYHQKKKKRRRRYNQPHEKMSRKEVNVSLTETVKMVLNVSEKNVSGKSFVKNVTIVSITRNVLTIIV